jgi:kynurenine formamidase
MCDSEGATIPGWKGWRAVPPPVISTATGEWVDFSHRVTESLSRIPFFPQPRIQRIMTWPPANVTEIQMVVHHGTHIDAPRHFISDGPTIDEIPLSRMYGPGVVWRIEAGPRGAIGIADLERATPRMRPGDIVFIDTGWWEKVNTEEYEEHPFLTREAAEWLVAQGAKIVGMDNSTPDMASHYRPKDFDYPVHRTLLSHGVLIVEHMNNLTALAGRRIEAMVLAINLAGSDGAPARVIARPLD